MYNNIFLFFPDRVTRQRKAPIGAEKIAAQQRQRLRNAGRSGEYAQHGAASGTVMMAHPESVFFDKGKER